VTEPVFIVKYDLWHSESDSSYAFFASDHGVPSYYSALDAAAPLRNVCQPRDMRYLPMTFVLVLFISGCGREEQAPLPVLAPNAPPDRPVDANGEAEVQKYKTAIAPYVQKARQTYPGARQRYLDGLPAGYSFFAVTNLKDHSGTEEQVFVAVTSIEGGRIRGRVASDILAVSGYRKGDPHTLPEDELIDWLIAHPDGTEEGNIVGKFLDEIQKSQR